MSPAQQTDSRVPLAPLGPSDSNSKLNQWNAAMLSIHDKNPVDTSNLKRPHSVLEEDDGSDDEDLLITDSCDVIRRKITKFLNSGEMKVTEFLRHINVNSNSYGRFMKLKGPYSGNANQTYAAAFRFFQKRKEAGVTEVPKKKVKKAEESKKLDVSTIHLEGEASESVPIYDTCDDVRRKIAAFLREPDVTQAAFLREVAKTFPEPKTIRSKQLKDFQAKKGPLEGSMSLVFYASYVFFEKLRLKQGKPESKKRLEMEDAWASKGGVDRSRPSGYVVCQGQVPVMNEYGQVTIQRR